MADCRLDRRVEALMAGGRLEVRQEALVADCRLDVVESARYLWEGALLLAPPLQALRSRSQSSPRWPAPSQWRWSLAS